MGGGSPSPPGPSKQEKAASASQAELLDLYRRQLEQQGVESRFIQPILYNELGLTPEYTQIAPQMSGAQLKTLIGNKLAKKSGVDASTMYTLEDALGFAGDNTDLQAKIQGRFESIQPTQQLSGLTKKPQTVEETKRDQISNAALDRELAALKGELPINPGLLSDLSKQEMQLQESLRKQLGPGWETSSPGIEAVKQFQLMRNTVLDNARRGDLTLADALQSNALGQQMGQQGQFFSLGSGATQMPFGNVSNYAQAAQSYGSLAQQLGAQRMGGAGGGGGGFSGGGAAMGALSGAATGAYIGSVVPGIGTALGAIGGGLFGGMGGGFSSREFKDNIEAADIDAILAALESTPVYHWNYKPEFGDARRHIGPVTEEAPPEIVDGKMLVGLDYMGFMFAAIKALAQKVRSLEV